MAGFLREQKGRRSDRTGKGFRSMGPIHETYPRNGRSIEKTGLRSERVGTRRGIRREARFESARRAPIRALVGKVRATPLDLGSKLGHEDPGKDLESSLRRRNEAADALEVEACGVQTRHKGTSGVEERRNSGHE